jgi:hypothetical protein
MASQFHNLAVKLADLLPDGIARFEQRSESITDLRTGVEKRRSGREVQRSTFARFSGSLDFRLLQQYRHLAIQAGQLPLLTDTVEKVEN